MATLETRTSPTGTSHRVKWRQDGLWQSETFGQHRKSAALRFKRDVEHAGNRWPDSWIKGVGYRQELLAPHVPDQALLSYALQLVNDKAGLQPDTRQRYARQVVTLAQELSEIVTADPETEASRASVQNLTDRRPEPRSRPGAAVRSASAHLVRRRPRGAASPCPSAPGRGRRAPERR